MRILRAALIVWVGFVIGGSIAEAQPVIRANSVVNAASYVQPGLPNYGIAQGGMFILRGSGLGTRGTVIADTFPLPVTMGGTFMKILIAGTTVNVVMLSVFAGQASDQFGSFDQLAGIVPSNTPTGTGTITVTYNGQTSAPASITIVPSAFGIFSINQGGIGPGVFTDPNFRVSTLVSAAHPGDLLFIWGTGLGPIAGNDAAAPPVGDLNVPVEVYVGNQRAAVGYHGRSGCCSGIDQILFTVPPGVEGCYVPVVVKTGNLVSNFTTLSVASSGNVCSDVTGFAVSELRNAQSGAAMGVADVFVERFSVKLSIPGTGIAQGNLDFPEIKFQSYPPNAVLGSTRGSAATVPFVPSAGCMVVPYTPKSNRLFENIDLSGDPDTSHTGLDAGAALNLAGPLGPKQIPRMDTGGGLFEYFLGETGAFGGGAPPLFSAGPDYLAPGDYTIDNGLGGTAVGPFSAQLAIPNSSPVWTNQDSIVNVPRSQDLTVTWSGGDALVVVQGNSANLGAHVGAEFFCSSPGAAGSLTVPSWVLSALPATSGTASDVALQVGFLGMFTTLPSPARFQARGVDVGYFNWSSHSLKNVNYQ